MRWWERVASDNKRTLNTISAKAIEAAVASLDPKTRSRKLAALKSYARWLLREGHPRLRMETEKLLPPKLPRGLPRDLGAAKFLEMRERVRRRSTSSSGPNLTRLMVMGGCDPEIETAQAQEKRGCGAKGQKNALCRCRSGSCSGCANSSAAGGGWAKPRGVIGVELVKLHPQAAHPAAYVCHGAFETGTEN